MGVPIDFDYARKRLSRGRSELQIVARGNCEALSDETHRNVLRLLAAGLGDEHYYRVVVDVRELVFDDIDPSQTNCVVSILYAASRSAERFQIVDDCRERRRRLQELTASAK